MIRSLIIAVVFVLISSACHKNQGAGAARVVSMQDSLVMAHIKTYVDTVWNQKDTTYLKVITSDHFKRILNGIEVADTRREMQSHLSVFFTGFPDMKLSLEQVYLLDRKAFIQWNTEGTNTGVFGEVAATGKKVKINGMSHLYFDAQGKLYREFTFYNELDLLQQLGYTLVPPVLQ